jgi:hypothetical protein
MREFPSLSPSLARVRTGDRQSYLGSVSAWSSISTSTQTRVPEIKTAKLMHSAKLCRDKKMTRIAALIAGLLLVACPAWWLIDFFGKGSSEGFVLMGWAFFAIYGSVLLGVAVSWVRANRSGQPLLANQVFRAGMFGLAAACILFFVGGSIYGIAKYGAFEKAIGGNLWGVLAIFWVVLGALVSAGIALLFFAWRGPAGAAAGPGTGPWSPPPRTSN